MYSLVFDPKYKTLSGIHKVQRVPPTEKRGRRQSSQIVVAAIESRSKELENVRGRNVRIDFYRDRGAGGQHRNKTDSAVRITDMETGIVVTAVEDRSQHKNKEVAWQRLESKLEELNNNVKQSLVNTQRAQSFAEYTWIWTDWRDEVRYNNKKYSMSKALKGRLDSLLDAR